MPRLYANAVEDIRKVEGDTYADYANSEVVFNWQDDYEFIEKIGRGRYSEVFKAQNLLTNETVVVKMLKPVKKEKVRRELMTLEAVKESPNVIKLIDQVADPSNVTPSFVFEYVKNQDFRSLYPNLTKT